MGWRIADPRSGTCPHLGATHEEESGAAGTADGFTDAFTDPKGPGDWCRADVLTLHFVFFQIVTRRECNLGRDGALELRKTVRISSFAIRRLCEARGVKTQIRSTLAALQGLSLTLASQTLTVPALRLACVKTCTWLQV